MTALSDDTVRLAGILLLTVTTIEIGGQFLLRIALGGHDASPLQRTFFRAGHAHAGLFVTLSLVAQLFVDATDLEGVALAVARLGVPTAAILVPAGFFLSVLRRDATEPNRLLVLVHLGTVALGAGVVALGVGLLAAA